MAVVAYYNEVDKNAAKWLRELIRCGHVASGDVDERSIVDVNAGDLDGYTQCHFFAGIGVWSNALRAAGWPDDRPVWTGSCPCQPFSVAGRGRGFNDERHLFPTWMGLIRQRRPSYIFGEQVAGKNGETWFDAVQSDLEEEKYACGAVTFPACGVGAPHTRQRLYWVADNIDTGRQRRVPGGENQERKAVNGHTGRDSPTDRAEHRYRTEFQIWVENNGSREAETFQRDETPTHRSYTNGHWEDVEWLPCKDGKFRPVKPGISPLVNGSPARVGRLRGYGNAIVAPQAAEFIKTFMEVTGL